MELTRIHQLEEQPRYFKYKMHIIYYIILIIYIILAFVVNDELVKVDSKVKSEACEGPHRLYRCSEWASIDTSLYI